MAEDDQPENESETVVDGGATPEVQTEVVLPPGAPLTDEQKAEFPSVWHRDAHIAALQRELDGAHVREDAEAAANVERELARLGATGKQTRPRGRGKQTR